MAKLVIWLEVLLAPDDPWASCCYLYISAPLLLNDILFRLIDVVGFVHSNILYILYLINLFIVLIFWHPLWDLRIDIVILLVFRI